MKNERYHPDATAPVEVINKRVRDFNAITGYVVRTTTVLSDGSIMVELMSLTARKGKQDVKTIILTGWRWFDQ